MPLTAADEVFMHLAIETAAAGVGAGQSPFGAAVVKGDVVVAVAHNVVWATTDITAHAEVTAIRAACQALGVIDLSGCIVYSTCEPCPMCFAACHWARVRRVVYGATIADAQRIGFHELGIASATMRELGGSTVELVGECLRAEAVAVMDAWCARWQATAY